MGKPWLMATLGTPSTLPIAASLVRSPRHAGPLAAVTTASVRCSDAHPALWIS
jgi:hypothetical protein